MFISCNKRIGNGYLDCKVYIYVYSEKINDFIPVYFNTNDLFSNKICEKVFTAKVAINPRIEKTQYENNGYKLFIENANEEIVYEITDSDYIYNVNEHKHYLCNLLSDFDSYIAKKYIDELSQKLIEVSSDYDKQTTEVGEKQK